MTSKDSGASMDGPRYDILFVEDNPADVRLVRRMLGAPGPFRFGVTHIDRCDNALELAAEQDYDAYLINLSLPDSRGLVTLDAFMEVDPTTPIVVYSGHVDETQAISAVQAGAKDYIVKGKADGAALQRCLVNAIERAKLEQQIAGLANCDDLTGLANRSQFHRNLEQSLHRAERAGSMVALLFIDLDGFKQINDTYGHGVGDRLLKGVADRLADCVRKTDTAFRLGGDEFTVICEGLAELDAAAVVAQKVLDALAPPFKIDGYEMSVGGSIGISLYPNCADDAENLIQNADSAMYQAKELGRNRYQFFLPELNIRHFEQKRLYDAIGHAIDNGEFVLHYQPQFDLGSGKLAGAEALIRWNHPEMGLLGPNHFIPFAERSGLIDRLGEWVFRAANDQIKRWSNADLAPIRVWVNASARQFGRPASGAKPGFRVDNGVAPAQLGLECPEDLFTNRVEGADSKLATLKSMGMEIAINDFATGQSTLRRLRHMPIDVLKIDRSLVSGICENPDDTAVAGAIIAFGRTLGLKVVAQGVETIEQVKFLRAQGCNRIQGHFVGKPLPADKFASCMRRSDVSVPVPAFVS
jgi:diguanylate cyclase (GGDEF)-like protein